MQDVVVTLNEGQGNQTEKKIILTFSQTIFTANLMGIALQFLKIKIFKHLLFS